MAEKENGQTPNHRLPFRRLLADDLAFRSLERDFPLGGTPEGALVATRNACSGYKPRLLKSNRA